VSNKASDKIQEKKRGRRRFGQEESNHTCAILGKRRKGLRGGKKGKSFKVIEKKGSIRSKNVRGKIILTGEKRRRRTCQNSEGRLTGKASPLLEKKSAKKGADARLFPQKENLKLRKSLGLKKVSVGRKVRGARKRKGAVG